MFTHTLPLHLTYEQPLLFTHTNTHSTNPININCVEINAHFQHALSAYTVIQSLSGDDDEDDEDYEEDAEEEGDIDRLVQTLVDSMAISIPSKHFVQPGKKRLNQLNKHKQLNQLNQRNQ